MKLKLYYRKEFDYFETQSTRWKDMDALRHINHAAYLTFMETARINYCNQLGYKTRRWEARGNFILASMKVDYLLQAEHPAVFDIGQRISRVGEKSFDILTAIFVHGQPSPIVQATFTLVSYSYQKRSSIPVPDAVKKAYNRSVMAS